MGKVSSLDDPNDFRRQDLLGQPDIVLVDRHARADALGLGLGLPVGIKAGQDIGRAVLGFHSCSDQEPQPHGHHGDPRLCRSHSDLLLQAE